MKIIQDSWKIWFRKGMLKNHSNKFNRAKLGFIPPHGIYHPSKPGKIRVVFDYSVEYNGVSVCASNGRYRSHFLSSVCG